MTMDDFQRRTDNADCLAFVFRDGCPHCRVLNTVIDKYRVDHPGLDVVHVNANEIPGILDALAVTRVPSLLVYRSGQVVARRSGLMNLAEMSTLVERAGQPHRP